MCIEPGEQENMCIEPGEQDIEIGEQKYRTKRTGV